MKTEDEIKDKIRYYELVVNDVDIPFNIRERYLSYSRLLKWVIGQQRNDKDEK